MSDEEFDEGADLSEIETPWAVVTVLKNLQTGEEIQTTHMYENRPLLIGIEVAEGDPELELDMTRRYGYWQEIFFGAEFNNLLDTIEGDQSWRRK
jgi:hypothetical protein